MKETFVSPLTRCRRSRERVGPEGDNEVLGQETKGGEGTAFANAAPPAGNTET
jgi:hypothetical protein